MPARYQPSKFHPSFMQDAAAALEIGPDEEEDGPETLSVQAGPEAKTLVEPIDNRTEHQ